MVIVGEDTAVTVNMSALLAMSELASVTCTVKSLVPVPVGVPEITPELEVRLNPAGRAPEMIDH